MQPPPCGCVLKQDQEKTVIIVIEQPPPCGCVLKRPDQNKGQKKTRAAASVRLCVETASHFYAFFKLSAAASVRLCVETRTISKCGYCRKAAASVRLCVETEIQVKPIYLV